MNKKKSKRGQITIFIIIAVIIVLSLSIIFYVHKKNPALTPLIENPKEDPVGYIRECSTNAFEETVTEILPRLEIFSPATFLKYNNTEGVYLCYTDQDDENCINNHPMLSVEMEIAIEKAITPKIKKCFDDMAAQLKNYDYKETLPLEVIVNILPTQVAIKINTEIQYTLGQKIIKFNNFDVSPKSAIYTLLSITNTIINQENNCDCLTQTCNADAIALNNQNPDWDIRRTPAGNKGEIYTVKHTITEEKLNFAVRNCMVTI